MPLLWSVKQAAGELNVSPRTVWRMVENNELPYIRVRGRIQIPVEAVKQWIDENMIPGHNSKGVGHGIPKRENIVCLNAKTKTEYIKGQTRPITGPVTSTRAAKELGDLLGLTTKKKPKRYCRNGN
jgi:excisionase family DNA binding protein